jgi:hypothetical protein
LGDTRHGSDLAPLSHHTLAGREAMPSINS